MLTLKGEVIVIVGDILEFVGDLNAFMKGSYCCCWRFLGDLAAFMRGSYEDIPALAFWDILSTFWGLFNDCILAFGAESDPTFFVFKM